MTRPMTLMTISPHFAALATLAAAGVASVPAMGQSNVADGPLACRAIDDGARRLACYDQLTMAAPGSDGAAQAAAPANPLQNFGFEQRLAQAAKASVAAIDTTIPGKFEGWGPNDRIHLANGQVWQVIDDSTVAMNLVDPKVTVRRGLFGAFYIEFEKTNRAARVRRVE